MWTKEQIAATVKQKSVLVGVASVVSASAGATLGYLVAGKRLSAKYALIAEQEIAEARRFYEEKEATDKLKKEGSYSDPVALAGEVINQLEEYSDRVDDLGYSNSEFAAPVVATNPLTSNAEAEAPAVKVEVTETTVEVVAEEPVVHNIFKDAKSANSYFDYEEEVTNRDPSKPYIISEEEFLESEKDYNQVTLTYFEGDDVLTDEQDAPIDDVERTVGEDNLIRWGHGSKDNNTVYIRNERIELEFEVIRSRGDYVKEVLGFIEHSDRPGRTYVRKFRRDDG